MSPDNEEESILSLLDELRIMAQVGLEHVDDPYDEERYERLLELTGEWYGRAVDLPSEDVHDRFTEEVGYVTPKVSADAVVLDGDDRVLLQRRADDGTWSLPGGYTEPNEPPQETAVRETREETGIVVEPLALSGVYTRLPGEHGPHCLVAHAYRCRRTGGELAVSREGTEVRYWEPDAVPEWHAHHRRVVADASVERVVWDG